MQGIYGMILRRLWQLIPVILIATLVVFGLIFLAPGDPALIIAGDYATPERVAEIREQYGFDRPFLVQYFDWLWGVLQGDLGQSLTSSESVVNLIANRLPHTILLGSYALLLGAVIGIPLGIIAATRQGTRLDTFVTSTASLGVAVPNFWLGIVFVAIFALDLRWFPATGAVLFSEAPLEALWYMTLPAIALSTTVIAVLARQLRSAFLEVLESQHFRTLRAKGLSQREILWKHGLRNTAPTMLTITALQLNRLLSASVVLEAVFAIPGIGSLISYSALNKDFPVIQGVTLILVVAIIFANLLVDVLSAILDPRVAAS